MQETKRGARNRKYRGGRSSRGEQSFAGSFLRASLIPARPLERSLREDAIYFGPFVTCRHGIDNFQSKRALFSSAARLRYALVMIILAILL